MRNNISLNQGQQFLNKRLNKRSIEGFETNTNQQLDDIRQKQQQFNNLLQQYKSLQQSTNSSYLEAISRSNSQYLNKNIAFNNGTKAYVTNRGIVKPYGSDEIYNNTIGKNGCPKDFVSLDIPWSSEYIKGSTIPLKPSLIVGSNMVQGESCGNEGLNVVASKLTNSIQSSYIGCYNNKPKSSNILAIPIMNASNESNGFKVSASSTYLNSNNYGPWCAFDQNKDTFWHSEVYYDDKTGKYNGTNSISITNVGEIRGEYLQVNAPTNNKMTITQYSILPRLDDDLFKYRSPNTWYIIGIKDNQLYQIDKQQNQSFNGSPKSYNIATPGAYDGYILLVEKVGNEDQSVTRSSTQIAEWSLYTNTDYSLTDDKLGMTMVTDPNLNSFDNCQDYALRNGYKYFSYGTNKCSVSNDISRIEAYGDASSSFTDIPLWSLNSGTSDSTNYYSQISSSGQLSIFDNNGLTIISANDGVNDCENGGKSQIISATYGGNCQQPIGNVTDKVINDYKCNKVKSCSIPISNSNFLTTNTSANCTNSFDIEYKCGGNSFTRNLANAEGQTMILDCSHYINKYCNFYVILQDDGNLCIYRGKDPSDNRGLVWSSRTSGQQQTPNPNWLSNKSKYGRNYLKLGETLLSGEWLGSNDGSTRLLMQTDGNLVLYTSNAELGCKKTTNDKMYGTDTINAVYQLNTIGNRGSLGKVAYIDTDSNLKEYPNEMLKYVNDYQIYPNMATNSNVNDINVLQVEDENNCKSSCNSLADCAGYVYQGSSKTCWLKNGIESGNNIYSNGNNLGIRKRGLLNSQKSCNTKIVDIDTIQYDNYVRGSNMTSDTECNVEMPNDEELNNIRKQLTTLGGDIAKQMSELYKIDNKIYEKLNMNSEEFNKKLNEYKNVIKEYKMEGMQTMNDIRGMLSDSDLQVLQSNYKYILWSILAVSVLTITINSMKK
jgi:hypothetical protein